MYHLFTQAPSLPATLQLRLLEAFRPLLENCGVNPAICCTQGLVYMLVTSLPQWDPSTHQALVAVLEIVGTHSISVRELKRIFGYMRSERGFRPVLEPAFAKAVQFMAFAPLQKPDHYFDFDGLSSGLAVRVLVVFQFRGVVVADVVVFAGFFFLFSFMIQCFIFFSVIVFSFSFLFFLFMLFYFMLFYFSVFFFPFFPLFFLTLLFIF